MTAGRRRLLLVLVGVLAVAVAATLALVVTSGDRLPAAAPGPSTQAPASTSPATDAGTPAPAQALDADEASRAFLDGYVDPDGRVVRRDQGGDTVSEGQAYALLVAAATDDQATFRRVWTWTQQHLVRADGLLSWRWQGGQVTDASSASDADLDTARALVVAGDRFGDATLTAAGVSLGTAVLDHETVTTELGRILVAGTWATEDPYAYNPSYASPAATALLAAASDDPRWAELETGSRAATTAVLDAAELPSDWAQVHADGKVEAMPGAAGRGNEGVRYGYDATRTPIRYVESCQAADVALAGRLTTALDRAPGYPAVRDLGGAPIGADESVVAAVGQAAAAAAVNQDTAAAAALLAADLRQQQTPTYYGAAWDALGRLLLTDDRLGGCPPLGA